MMSLKVLNDYTGLRIGKVTVLGRVKNIRVHVLRTGEEHKPQRMWRLQCDCGHVWSVPHSRITTRSPSSCISCVDRTPKQKLSRSKEYVKREHPSYGSWYAMIRRCTSSKHDHWHNYGGRGITVCEEWLDFDKFVKDMGVRPEGKTIDRIDNDKGYCKDNCRWATPKEQRANMRPRKRRS